MVGYLRKITRIKKIGHAGTLDPFATGLLLVGIGREATKRLEEFKEMKKVYVATMQLGAVSDTFDATGKITPSNGTSPFTIDKKTIEHILLTFLGEQDQIPPMYSAKKINGEKLYTLARKGIEVERKPSRITIEQIHLLNISPTSTTEFPLITIEIVCSPGTYIRTLVHDIGQKLGTGAYCQTLTRTAIGDFLVENAKEVQTLTPEIIEQELFSLPSIVD